jgi:hypothetical protein
VLSLPATFVLVAIGAIGLYLALPRGPESEPRAVRGAGALLGTASLVFLALASVGGVPDRSPSSLATAHGALAYYGGGLAALLAASTAVSARTVGACVAAFAALLAAGSGLTALAGSAMAAWPELALAALAAALVVGIRRRRPAGDRGSAGESPALLEISREPLLACVGGALLATCLTVAGQAAAVNELPRTVEVERNAQPPSQRNRAWPRFRVIEQMTGAAPARFDNRAAAAERAEARADQSAPGDSAVLHHLLMTAALMLGIGAVGLLARRRTWAVAASAGIVVQAVILLLAAFQALPVGPAQPHRPLLAVLVVVVECGLLVCAATVLSGGSLRRMHARRDPDARSVRVAAHQAGSTAGA